MFLHSLVDHRAEHLKKNWQSRLDTQATVDKPHMDNAKCFALNINKRENFLLIIDGDPV
jgi:hypothetical protein